MQSVEPVFNKPNTKVNPFSSSNIRKAQITLVATGQNFRNTLNAIDGANGNLYTYLKFNPNTVTGAILQQLKADSSIQILDFSFANGELYNDEFALDEQKARQLSDGSLYAVVKKNTSTETTLRGASLNAVILDELYLPAEEDTTLQFQAFREAGYTEEMIARIRLCLFKRPSGFVRYLDGETGELVNVPGMQVWGLVFGIPLHTYTDGNGYYRFPWRFNAGTIMGTKAKNSKVNIHPVNTQGAWLYLVAAQFIIGSVHVQGWVSSCNMRNEVNFEFTTHKQNRYWAQMIHAVSLHDQYAAADGIQAAPRSLSVYAQWADAYGGASAPMLGHISGTPGSLIVQYLGGVLLGSNPNDIPNIFNLLTGALPDITVRAGFRERERHSTRLMQTAFHELGHASHFQRAGQGYWLDFIRATLRRHPADQCGGGYGCGQNPDDGNVAIGESWAEFIGTNHALRNHRNGVKSSRWQSLTTTGLWNVYSPITFGRALEREPWFFNDWIASGIYNDLIDG